MVELISEVAVVTGHNPVMQIWGYVCFAIVRGISMPIYIEWENKQKTLLRQKFVDSWTIPEYYESITRYNEMQTSVKHPVHTIVDLRASHIPPANAFPAAHNTMLNRYGNQGYIFILNPKPILRVLMNTFLVGKPALKNKVLFIDHVKETDSLIHQYEVMKHTPPY